ncbi:MAG: Rpn family recombination-promoting nuclease/putative transposase, partial [Selenomonadaceae bacterium]|nr:Rpn family recombination-promoting nuclease/putative transposase [Selenomonadaceae bacterium]
MLVKFRRRYFLKYAIKPWEELTIKDDYMFKKVMSYKRLCKRMLEKLLKIEINDIKYVEEEKTTKVAYVSKGIRLDVYVKDDKNTVYNVEMQVRNLQDNSLFKRIRYYQSVIDTDLLTVGDLYDTLNQTFVIFICPFSVLDGKRHIYTFKNICVEDKSIEMEDGATKMLISTKGMMNDVTPDV